VQAVFGFLRRKAGNGKKLKCGSVTFIQRFGDALRLNLHYHMLALDGVYALDENVAGVNLHANVLIPCHDKIRLERLCRYAARPSIDKSRLSGLPDGRLMYKLKRRWRDGTRAVIYEPLEFMEKLAALVPPPRFNLVRYSGVLAPSSGLRKHIFPAKPADDSVDDFSVCKHHKKTYASSFKSKDNNGLHERRNEWSELLKRVFSVDSLKCPRCGGRMRIVCAINPPAAIEKILDHLGIPSKPPPRLRGSYARQAISPPALGCSIEEYIN
jgi:hypothetical protein